MMQRLVEAVAVAVAVAEGVVVVEAPFAKARSRLFPH